MLDDSEIDYKDTPFINTIWINKDASYIVTRISIFLPVVIFGIFGNILIIYILAKKRCIRTPTNMLIGNMAFADLLSLSLHPWIILTYDFFQNYELGPVICRGEAAYECTTLIASVISMATITYDRLTAIVLPKETRLTRRGAKIVIALTWIIGIALSSPLIAYRKYKERQWKDFLEKYCTEKTVVLNMYWYVIITVLVWLPLIIQLICYISLFVKLNKYEKQFQNKWGNRQVSYKKMVAKMMFFVIVTFMICRLPFTAFIMYRHQLIKVKKLSSSSSVANQVNGTYHTIWFMSKLLIFVNAALNPLIYGIKNKRFCKAFKETKLSKWLFPPENQSTPFHISGGKKNSKLETRT